LEINAFSNQENALIKKKISIGNILVIHTREVSDEKKIHIRFVCNNEDDEERKRRLKSL